MRNSPLTLRARQIRLEAADVVSLELEALDGAALPAHAPGAHVDVQVPGGRGGSRWLHQQIRVGMPLSVTFAGNHFALEEGAPLSVFVAGGISITPLRSMIGRLVQLGRPWELRYEAASPAKMPFQDQMAEYAARGQGRVAVMEGEPDHRDIFLTDAERAANDSILVCCSGARTASLTLDV